MTQKCTKGLRSAENSCKSTVNKAKSDCEDAIPVVGGRKKRNIWYGGQHKIHIMKDFDTYHQVFDLKGFQTKNPNIATRKQNIFQGSDKNAYLEKVKSRLLMEVGPRREIGLKPK